MKEIYWYWIIGAIALVWLGGIPVAKGAAKKGMKHPEWWQYGLWLLWAAIDAVLAACMGTVKALAWVWNSLETLGEKWAGDGQTDANTAHADSPEEAATGDHTEFSISAPGESLAARLDA